MSSQIPNSASRNIISDANRQTRHKRQSSATAPLPTTKRRVSAPSGDGNTFQGGSSVGGSFSSQGTTTTHLSSLPVSSSRVLDSSRRVSSAQSGTRRVRLQAIQTPSATPTSSARSGTTVASSTRRVDSSPAPSGNSSPSPFVGLANQPVPITTPEARASITHPLRKAGRDANQRTKAWQIPPQAVSTPRSAVAGSRSIHRFGHSDMTRLVFHTSRHLELYMWRRRPFMSASDLEVVGYSTPRVGNTLAEAQNTDDREVLEHGKGGEQHLVCCVRGTDQGDFKRGMYKQRHAWDILVHIRTRFELRSTK